MRTFLFFKIFFKKVLSENFGSWPPLKFWSHDAPAALQGESREEQTNDRLLIVTVKGKSQVLLQTAQGIALGKDSSKGIPMCILLDNGSQRGYVTDELKKKLNVQVESAENLN